MKNSPLPSADSTVFIDKGVSKQEAESSPALSKKDGLTSPMAPKNDLIDHAKHLEMIKTMNINEKLDTN